MSLDCSSSEPLFPSSQVSQSQSCNHRGGCAAYCTCSDPATTLIRHKWSVVVVLKPSIVCLELPVSSMDPPVLLPFGLRVCLRHTPTCAVTVRFHLQANRCPPLHHHPSHPSSSCPHLHTSAHTNIWGCSQKKWSPPSGSVVHTCDYFFPTCDRNPVSSFTTRTHNRSSKYVSHLQRQKPTDIHLRPLSSFFSSFVTFWGTAL